MTFSVIIPRCVRSLLLTSCALSLIVGACTPSTPPDNFPESVADQSASDPLGDEASAGPHAAPDRPLAPRLITENETKTARRIALDLGNTTNGHFSAPKRGTVILPTQGAEPSPIVILSHLRAPNCRDLSFAYPCSTGVEEFHYDEGMIYLGDHLAEQGYTVLIPDLGAVYIGADLQQPYSQTAMWEDIVGGLMDSVRTDYVGQTTILGTDIVRPIDFETVGLVAHSRSGNVIESAMKVAGEGRLKSVFAYGPAYDTVELEYISSPLPDVPYLALTGSLDADVGSSANLLLGHYATTPRTTPASAVEVPGLGHMYVNRAASVAAFDDRIGCDVLDCPDAAVHEQVLMEASADWLNATLRHADTSLPRFAHNVLPAQVAGLPARWLAVTPRALAHLEPSALTAISGQSLLVCVFSDSRDSVHTPCPETDNGFVEILTPVAHINLGASASVDVVDPRGMTLQVSPSGTYEGQQGTAIKVTLLLANGSHHVVEVPSTHPALVSRKTDEDNGTYRLGTVRIPLNDLHEGAHVKGILIESQGHPIEVRSVDFWK